MEFKGPVRDSASSNPTACIGASTPPGGNEFRAVRPSIPPAPFFQGFGAMGNQVPFVFPHPFMPIAPGAAFAPAAQVFPPATIDLTEGSQKRASQECVTD